MPSLTVIYYAGLVPAACLMMAGAMWLANRPEENVSRPIAIGLCLFAAVAWPLSLPIAVVIKVSEWIHLDGWIDAYISWLERMAKRYLP